LDHSFVPTCNLQITARSGRQPFTPVGGELAGSEATEARGLPERAQW